ncbi:MAG: hypothetical protein CL524_08290 [Aequorivita sp.]|nr:hypothetical protein [Aequorivita sp.]|tara:strand:+ start:637 stop:1050 length:414 start_codon:yes stop_codon:yes gene_type:complete
MSQAIKTALYTKLTTDQTASSVYTAVGGRIYELQGKDDDPLPLLTYEVTSSPIAGLYNGTVIEKSQVILTIYGHRRLGAQAVGDIEAKLFTLLNQTTLAPTGYDSNTVMICLDRDRRNVFDEIITSESIYAIDATTA